jgi:hypothetical protein
MLIVSSDFIKPAVLRPRYVVGVLTGSRSIERVDITTPPLLVWPPFRQRGAASVRGIRLSVGQHTILLGLVSIFMPYVQPEYITILANEREVLYTAFESPEDLPIACP